MFSPRYAILTALLLAIALIPTFIHNYLGLKIYDERSTANISNQFAGFDSRHTQRNRDWGEVTFDCFDWFERIYKDEKGHSIRLFVCRSFDHKKLYHHPELALSYGENFNRVKSHNLLLPQQITIYLLRAQKERGIAAYALLYGNKFISNPILHNIKNSVNLLTNGRKPLTLFYVSDTSEDSKIPVKKSKAIFLLKQAINNFINHE